VVSSARRTKNQEKAMSYDADPRSIMRRVSDWGAQAVISRDDYAVVESAIMRHYDERGRVFEDMVNTLKRETDIQSPWDNLCDKGLELNERLRSTVEPKLNATDGRGFNDSQMSSFYEGEKLAWAACKAKIAVFGEAFHDIRENNELIFKKLEEDLKSAQSEAKAIDEIVRATFEKTIGDQVRTFGAEGVGAAITLKAAAVSGGFFGKVLAPKAKELVKSLITGDSELREAERRKTAAKAVLMANTDLVGKAREQINSSAIEDVLKRSEEIAHSWKEATRNDYKQDWERFGNDCLEVMRDKAARAKAKADTLFDNMVPLYTEALTQSFKSILSDRSSLDSFFGRLSDSTQKILDDLSKEDEFLATLKASDPTRSAVDTMEQIKKDLTQQLEELKLDIRRLDERMRSS
jgi:hypothetical protein